jgi:serine O-acetyltransferase
MDLHLDEAEIAGAKDVDAHGSAGDLHLFGDPDQQELMEIARRLHAADLDSAAALRLSGNLTRRHINEVLQDLLDLLFPGLFHQHGRRGVSPGTTKDALKKIHKKLSICIDAARSIDVSPPPRSGQLETRKVGMAFLRDLPRIRRALIDDVRAAYEADSAASSIHEVLLAYPGFIALAGHRLAHRLHALGVPLIPRMMSEWAHTLTGIDIHPGATLGKCVFIDHGTGVVVGETAVIGDNVKLYQGVTLGAASTRDRCSTKRHPTIQSNVKIYAHATILGGTTVIGKNSVVGASVLLAKSLPENSAVTTERFNVVKTLQVEAVGQRG